MEKQSLLEVPRGIGEAPLIRHVQRPMNIGALMPGGLRRRRSAALTATLSDCTALRNRVYGGSSSFFICGSTRGRSMTHRGLVTLHICFVISAPTIVFLTKNEAKRRRSFVGMQCRSRQLPRNECLSRGLYNSMCAAAPIRLNRVKRISAGITARLAQRRSRRARRLGIRSCSTTPMRDHGVATYFGRSC